jgi:serine/threonine-protein kinase
MLNDSNEPDHEPDRVHDSPTMILPHLADRDSSIERCPRPSPEAPEERPGAYPSVPGYDLLGILGSGGMGVVYKARQLSLGRLVALKMMRPEDGTDPALLARFQIEAEAVAQLHHPGIVQVHEIGQCEGRPFLCLEFVSGQTLADWIDGKPRDPRTVADLVLQMAEALHHAHGHGIIHRDMKPANVLLDEMSRPRITDFGIAHLLAGNSRGLTRNGELLGTPAYMAPEQAGGGTISTATDVYALGVILYEMLTGRPPFVAPTGLQTIEMVLAAEPVPLRKLQPGVPPDLETITLKCLAKEPRHRYADAQALADDLRRWLDSKPILARPITRVQRLARWCVRNPGTAALTAALTATVVGLAILGSIWYRSAQEQRMEEALRNERVRSERVASEKALLADLEQIRTGLHEEDWNAAREALGHAEGILQRGDISGGPYRLDSYRQALDLVAQFERVQARLGRAHNDKFDLPGSDAGYRAALEPVGVTLNRAIDDCWVHTLQTSPVRREIIRAIDSWAVLRVQLNDAPGCYWLLTLNNSLDDDPWQRDARQELLASDFGKLEDRSRQARGEKRTRDQLRLLATLLQSTGHWDEAKRLLRIAQLHYPNDFVFNNTLGLMLMEARDRDSWTEALGCFRAALAIRPASAGVQLNAGVMLWRLEQSVEALEAYRRAAELQPDFAAAHCNQGVMLDILQRPDEAAGCYVRAVDLGIANPLPYYNLALIRIRQGRLDDVRAVLTRAAQRRVYHFGEMQKILGELIRRHLEEMALEERARILPLDPDNAHLLYDQGTDLHVQGRSREAIPYLRRALELLPNEPTVHCNLGLALVETGQFGEGASALCAGHALAAQDPRWRFPSDRWVADAYELARLERLLEDRPLDLLFSQLHPKELEHLGRLLAIQGRYRDALAAYLHGMNRAGEKRIPLEFSIRWAAARVGLLAGLGQGLTPPPVEERAGLRKLALDLLRADLGELQQRLAQQGEPGARFVLAYLDAFSATREGRDLRKQALGSALPADERPAWLDLFRQHDQVRAQAHKQLQPAPSPPMSPSAPAQ